MFERGQMKRESRPRVLATFFVALVALVLVAGKGCRAFDISVGVGQVTPTSCSQHREGVRFAIRKINELNGGRGFPIGYLQTDFVKFNDDTQIVDEDTFTGSAYETEHQSRLQGLVAGGSGVDFLVGTCSPKSANEDTIANGASKMLLALVGPNSYYEPKLDYIFGMHISSYTYTEPTLKQVQFQGAKTVAIAGRKQSLFFQSTCAEGEKYAQQYGMTLAMERIEYEASGDNSLVKDEAYQREVATKMCRSGADVYMGCVGWDEAKVWLQVWHENDCKPKAVWLTCMTWGWKNNMANQIDDGQYLLGAGQWHEAMTYKDEVVGNSTQFAAEFEPIYGFKPNYDAVAAYTAVYCYMRAIQKAFRDVTLSGTGSDLISNNYETIRRTLSFLIERETIYGPVEFDLEFKRNIGRQPANMQFLGSYDATEDKMVDYCIAPSDVANSAIQYPAPSSVSCETGKRYVSNTEVLTGTAGKRCLMCNKCLECGDRYDADVGSCDFDGKRPVTYEWSSSYSYRCTPSLQLPANKTIDCEYLPVNSGFALGVFIIDACGMLVSFVCIVFILLKRQEQGIRRSQPFFMISFLVGALICNAASMPFVGPAENFSCAMKPLLISLGTSLMLSALIVKMMRIKKIITMAEKLVAKAVTVRDLLPVFVSMWGIAVGIWIFWVSLDAPVKTAYLQVIDPFNATKMYNCSTTSVFETLLIFYLGGLLLYSCVLAYQIRQMPDDLQESKTLLFSAYTIFLFAAFGIPLLFLINDVMIKVLLMSFFINIPVLITVVSLCFPKLAAAYGYNWKSETPSAIQTLASAYGGTKMTSQTVTTTTTTTTDGGATKISKNQVSPQPTSTPDEGKPAEGEKE